MATTYTPLWIDPFENRLYSAWQSNQTAPPLIFGQGDSIEFELFLIKKPLTGATGMEEVPFPDGCTIRFAVGKIDAEPEGGNYTITYDGDTATVAYDATAAEIQTALNALASITAAGGVTVQKVSQVALWIKFNVAGVNDPFVINVGGLLPTSAGKIVTIKNGAVGVKGVYLMKIFQAPAVFHDEWEDSPEPTLTVETLIENRSKRVKISPIPISGSWTLTSTPNLLVLTEKDGDEDNLADYWNDTVSYPLGAFTTTAGWLPTEDVPAYQRGRMYWQLDVANIGLCQYDFTLMNNFPIPVDYVMPFSVQSNFERFPSKIGVVSFNTAEVEYLLAGGTSATASLEIEVESPGGERWTILQTTCTIKNDLIDVESYSPLQFTNPVYEAPVDGQQYVRKDGAWTLLNIDGGTY